MPVLLVVTSDPSLIAVHRPALESRGHVVLAAASAPGGIERLREGGIDAVVLDHGLPGGVEALVSKLHGLPDPPPFLLLSRAVDAPSLSAHLGASGFLPLPCDPGELADSLTSLLIPGVIPLSVEDRPTQPHERR